MGKISYKICLPLFMAGLGLFLIVSNLDSYYCYAPSEVVVQSGEEASLPITIVNSSNSELSVLWAGDCCSLPISAKLRPLEKRTLPIKFNTTGMGKGNILKNATLQLTQEGKTYTVSLPFDLKVRA